MSRGTGALGPGFAGISTRLRCYLTTKNVMKVRVFGVIFAAILTVLLHAETANETPLRKPFYVDARSGEAHLSLNGAWDLGYGPWLRSQVETVPTKLELKGICRTDLNETESSIRVKVRKAGSTPAFDAHLYIAGTMRVFYGTDNDFWLAPGEERMLDLRVLWKDPATRPKASLTAVAWNAGLIEVPVLAQQGREDALPASESR